MEVRGEAAALGPGDEGSDVPSRDAAFVEPPVEFGLSELIKACSLVIEPGQQFDYSPQPMGGAPEPGIPVAEFNAELRRYNAVAAEEAARAGALFADLYAAFTEALESAPGAGPLWSDGVHLSPAGDAVAHQAVLAALAGPGGGPGHG
ncbi:hypothetical protein GCM10010295_36480 [Streptomyces intermedius]